MTSDRPHQLLELARQIVDRTQEFHATKGPGKGDHATLAFMAELRAASVEALGEDLSEFKVRRRTAGRTTQLPL